MAQWNNSSGHFIRPYRSAYSSPAIRYFQESTAGASTALIAVGDVVRRSTVTSTGGLRVVRDWSTAGDGGNLMHIGGAEVLGIAVTASTGEAGTTGLVDDSSQAPPVYVRRTIGVALADGLTEFLGYFYQGDTTAPARSSRVNSVRPLQRDSTLNVMFIASTNTTAALANIRIVDFPNDVLGDSGGVPCVFKFLSSAVYPAIRIGSHEQ